MPATVPMQTSFRGSATGSAQPFRWIIFGTGAVARKFVFGLRRLGDRATVVCVASRRPENAALFARDLGVPQAADYAAAAVCEAEAIYVATPPSEHEAHALLAIAAGKAVLIEKPFALDAPAAERIAAAATQAGVFCMEAMWTRFLPLLTEVRARIAAGDLGEIRGFHGSFCGADVPDAAKSLFDPARGGGALMHRGVYPLSLAHHLLGPVVEARGMAHLGATGVDEDCALTLGHASGAITTLRASLRSAGTSDMTIFGTRGTLWIKAPVYRPFSAVLTPTKTASDKSMGGGGGRFAALREGALAQGVSQRFAVLAGQLSGRGVRITARYLGNGYHHEAEAVMDAVAAGRTESPLMPLSESIAIMAIMDAARAEWHKTRDGAEGHRTEERAGTPAQAAPT